MNRVLRVLTYGILIVIIGCSQPIAYSEGISNCDKIHNDKMDAEIEKLKKGLKSSPVMKTPECLIGVSLPSFQIKSLNRDFNVNELRGKKTILCFWESNCPPCIYRIPVYNKLKDELGSENYNFISIGLDSQEDIVKSTEKHSWTYTHALNGRELIEDVFELNFGYPVTFLVDEDLVIVAKIPSSKIEEVESGEAYSEVLKIIREND